MIRVKIVKFLYVFLKLLLIFVFVDVFILANLYNHLQEKMYKFYILTQRSQNSLPF